MGISNIILIPPSTVEKLQANLGVILVLLLERLHSLCKETLTDRQAVVMKAGHRTLAWQ